MKHLDEGTLQAFLDDELGSEQRADAAEHLLGCPTCRAAKDELSRAHTVFSEAVSVLDVDAPSETARGNGRQVAALGGPFVKAASLTLLLAAAASAAVPGSPVRQWIVEVVESPPVEESAPEPVEPAPEPVAEPVPQPVPAGVSVSAAGPVDVALADLEGTTVRLVETAGTRVTVSVLGAETDPVFEMAAGTIRVRDAVGGEVIVEWPASLVTGRLVVDGKLWAAKDESGLRIHVPAETVEGDRVWQ